MPSSKCSSGTTSLRASTTFRHGIPTLRAAWWALRATRDARRQLGSRGFDSVRLEAPPTLPAPAEIGVSAVLRLKNEACLVRAMVRQAWHSAHGSSRDIVIGVRKPGGNFQAHAWLEGDPPCHAEGFQELLRVSAGE
jgi:hypothetical protein